MAKGAALEPSRLAPDEDKAGRGDVDQRYPGRLPRLVRRLTVYGFLLGIGVVVVVVYLPLYAEEVLGMSRGQAGLVLAVTGPVGIVARIGWAKAAEGRLGMARSLMVIAFLGGALRFCSGVWESDGDLGDLGRGDSDGPQCLCLDFRRDACCYRGSSGVPGRKRFGGGVLRLHKWFRCRRSLVWMVGGCARRLHPGLVGDHRPFWGRFFGHVHDQRRHRPFGADQQRRLAVVRSKKKGLPSAIRFHSVSLGRLGWGC